MKKLLYIAISLIALNATAQSVAINTDGSAADNSALLDLKSTNQGVLVPRMTQANRNAITSPATGLMIFQTDNTQGFYYNAGTPATPNWQPVGSGGSTASGSTVVLEVECTTAGTYVSGLSSQSDSGFPRYDNVIISPPSSIGTFTPFTGTGTDIQHTLNSTGTSVPNKPAPAFIANQAGYYAITATIVSVIPTNNPITATTAIAPFINITTSTGAHKDAYYGNGTLSSAFPNYTKGRGLVTAFVKLEVGDRVGIFGTNVSTINSPKNSTDGSTKLTIVKL